MFKTLGLTIVLVVLAADDKPKPKAFDTQYKKVVELAKAKEYEKALAVAKEILDEDPDQADAWALTAFLHNQKKEFREAARAARRAVRVKDDHAMGWGELAFALYQQKKYEEARPALERAIELNPRAWPAYDALAACLKELGKEDEAEAVLKKKAERMSAAEKDQEKKPTKKKD